MGTQNDGSTGEVVIRPGPPASSGGQGFFSIGGGGGFGGGFGGSSSKRRRKRLRARAQAIARAQAEQQAQTEATARAQAQALALAHRQYIDAHVQARDARKAELDRHFSARTQSLAQALQAEVLAARKRPQSDGSERWQLYLITKERQEINGLIAAKSIELQNKEALARSIDGQDPLEHSSQDYSNWLEQMGSSQAISQAHQAWEPAYTAAHEARLLSEAIRQLSEQSQALTVRHAEQERVWRARDQEWERQRLYAQQRDERIRFKQQAAEDMRQELVKQANTLTAPIESVVTGAGLVLTRGGALVAQGAAAVLEQTVGSAITELARVLAIRAGQTVSLTATALFYSPELGNGELTPAQRSRLFQGIGIRADMLGLRDGQDLQTIADAGGAAEVSYRLKPQAVPDATAIIVADTGHDIPAQVPVRNAVFDPLTDTYSVDTPGSAGKRLRFTANAAPGDGAGSAEQGQAATSPGLLSITPQVEAIPSGADSRINDCIVCIPGQTPLYFTFDVPPIGTGVVTGAGQPAAWDWWKATTAEAGAPIPAQVGDLFRGREFASFGAFDDALWRTIAEDENLGAQFNDINKKRIANGFAPIAQKSTWVGDRREFEIRYPLAAAQGTEPYNLDHLSITRPDSAQGVRPLSQPLAPWLTPDSAAELEIANAIAQQPQGNRTWTPLIPPGSETLGSTTLLQGPVLPGVYPGDTTDPIQPQIETLPGVDEEDVNASIPGFGADGDLPFDLLYESRRDDPGVANGHGQPVSGIWLEESKRGSGASIPTQIAEQLRGQEYSSFRKFREAFWQAVAEDSELSKQFNELNLDTMRDGSAPYPPKAEQVGKRKKFEVHHRVEVSKGGAIYDMENLTIVTPKRHIEIHKGGK